MNVNLPGGEQQERDTTELSTQEILGLKLGPEDEEVTRKLLERDEEADGFGPNNPGGGLSLENIGGYLTTYWYYAAAVAAILLLILVLLTRGSVGGASDEPAEPSSSNPKPEAAASEPAGPVKATGIGFAEPVTKDGGYYLRSGEISWKGKIKNTDTGQELTLEGPSAAQFKRAVALPHGEIMTGVFGRAQPDQPIVHGTFHRVSLGDEERTTGTYFAVRDETVLVEGTYIDERDGDTIVRTYHDDYPEGQEDRNYRVSFEAPTDVPIPTLVGWEPPAVETESYGIRLITCALPTRGGRRLPRRTGSSAVHRHRSFDPQ